MSEQSTVVQRTALVLGGTGMLKGCADDLLAQAEGWHVVLPSRRPEASLGLVAKAALRGRAHVPQSRVSAGPPHGQVSGDLPNGQVPDDLPHGQVSEGLPNGQVPDDLPHGQVSEDPPHGQVTQERVYRVAEPGRGGARRVAVAADWTRPDELAARVRQVMERPADLLVAWVHTSYREAVLRAVAPLLAPHAPVVEVYDSGAIDPVRGVPDPTLDGHPTQQVVLGFVRHGGSTRWLSHEEASVGVVEAVHRALDGRPPSVHQVGEIDSWVMRH